MSYGRKCVSEKNIDIFFMGSPFKNRLCILEALAKRAERKKWKLKIIGPFYDKKYPWKKYVFAKKYPHVNKFLENRVIRSEEANEFYAESKICLNIHDARHKCLNPRSFDILAAGAFEMVDVRERYTGDIQPGKALVEFTDIEDLSGKIEYYLQNDEERKKIAKYGYEHNIYSMENSLRTILDM